VKLDSLDWLIVLGMLCLFLLVLLGLD